MDEPEGEQAGDSVALEALRRAQKHAFARGSRRGGLAHVAGRMARRARGGERAPAASPEGREAGRRRRPSWAGGPGMARSRTGAGPSRWDPQPIGRVLRGVSRARGWEHPEAMGLVTARWPRIVGQNVAEHCAIERFVDSRLEVRTTSTAWAKALQLLLPRIERSIADEVGEGVVTQVIVRGPAIPSWRRGPLSVPGRGPRDTYG